MKRSSDKEDTDDLLRGLIEQTAGARELIGLSRDRRDGFERDEAGSEMAPSRTEVGVTKTELSRGAIKKKGTIPPNPKASGKRTWRAPR